VVTGRTTLPFFAIHHKAVHAGSLVIARVDDELVFRHADGSPYGRIASAARAAAFADAFAGLTSCGYREREARAALDRVDAHVGARPSSEDVLRAALRALAPSRCGERAVAWGRAGAHQV
jgi:hypothetical protein